MPSNPAAVLPPATPDWIARALGYESGADFDECYLGNTYYEVPKQKLYSLLVSVRGGALREAAS